MFSQIVPILLSPSFLLVTVPIILPVFLNVAVLMVLWSVYLALTNLGVYENCSVAYFAFAVLAYLTLYLYYVDFDSVVAVAVVVAAVGPFVFVVIVVPLELIAVPKNGKELFILFKIKKKKILKETKFFF